MDQSLQGKAMNEKPRDTRIPAERVHDIYVMEAAMQEAVRAEIIRHKKLGNPICVSEDGRVKWIQPKDIPEDGIWPDQSRNI